jgi:hypothetical protein
MLCYLATGIFKFLWSEYWAEMHQVLLIQISWVSFGYQATRAFESNFFGSGAGQEQQMLISQILFGSYAGYNATDASNSNFFGNKLVMAQQVLLIQISLVQCWSRRNRC